MKGYKYCLSCYSNLEPVELEEESFYLEIPEAISNRHMVFRDNFVEDNGKKFYYKDVTEVAFDSSKRSVSVCFVPVWKSQSYNFYLAFGEEAINLSLKSIWYKGNKGKQNIWLILIDFFENVIQPVLLENLVIMIFEKNNPISIGGINFNNEGYDRIKYNRGYAGVKESVLWSDKIYTPRFSSGNVILYQDVQDRICEFARIPTSRPNAVILPELINACVNEYSLRQEKMKL